MSTRRTTTATGPADDVCDPKLWWRRLCWVTPDVAVSGDLPEGAAKRRALDEWVAAGVTHVVDTRLEHSDEEFVRSHAESVGYTWVGVDDHGGRQPDWWFDEGVSAVLRAVEQPAGKVLVHCHMGINRGPSMAFAAMLAMGHEAIDALCRIREVRPIAAVHYAEDAVSWWQRGNGVDRMEIYAQMREVRRWQQDHPVDTDWVTSRIWRDGD